MVYGKGAGQGLERLDIATKLSVPLISGAKDACWSPDGRRIAFVREESYNSYLTEQVWVMDQDGKDPRKLVNGGFPSWSRDGKKLFVHSRQENSVLEVDPADPVAPPTVFFAKTPSWYFSVSSDQTRIAFGCAGRLEIRERANGKLVGSWPTPQERGLLPAWSPDGKLIAFGGFDGSRLGLWVLEVATMRAVQIMDGDYTMPAWSQDSSSLAFDCRSGEREIWTTGRKYLDTRLADARSAPSVTAPEQQPPPQETADTASLMGKPAPDFNLRSLDGSTVALSDLKGRVVILDFWATWCPPCRKSLPHLQRLSEDAALLKKGLQVIAVDLRETKEKVREFLTQNSFNFRVALDSEGATAEKYWVHGIPTTLVIDRNGVVRRVFIGFGDTSERELDDAVQAVLSGG
jgi:peroxiredoxin